MYEGRNGEKERLREVETERLRDKVKIWNLKVF